MPAALLDTGEYITVAPALQHGPSPPAWFEYIDVYPGPEAAGLVKTLAALIQRWHRSRRADPAPGPGRLAPLPDGIAGPRHAGMYLSNQVTSRVR
jgi:hypothetical protein